MINQRRLSWRDYSAGLLVLAMVILNVVNATIWQTGLAENTTEQKIKQHLTAAHSQTASAVDVRIESVHALFDRCRKGAYGFAEDALSWRGKWALIQEKTGIGDEKAHAKLLAELFSKYIFTNEALKTVLTGAVQGYLRDVDAIENQMLVRLRADLADSELGRDGKIPSAANDAVFREEYQRLAPNIMGMLELDGGMEIGRQLAGFVAMDVATPVVIRIVEFVAAELGIETGILSIGAASSVYTLGIGLIVGIIADQAIAWVLKEAGYDPAAQIAAKIVGSLDRVEALVIDGTEDKGGLRRELQTLGNARSRCQDAVMRRLMQEGGGR